MCLLHSKKSSMENKAFIFRHLFLLLLLQIFHQGCSFNLEKVRICTHIRYTFHSLTILKHNRCNKIEFQHNVAWSNRKENILIRHKIEIFQINLSNSKIESIEHITMNPGPDLYMEYYSDYDFQDNGEENYDHIGDIEDLVIKPRITRPI